MESYQLEMTAEDIGEIVELIRIKYLKMNEEVFCAKLDLSPKVLFSVEEGKGPHGMNVLKKIHQVFPNIKVGVTVDIT